MASNDEPGTQTTTTSSTGASSQDAGAELNAQLEDLLNTLSNKFAGVSSEIFAKMDEMSRRLDNLESQLAINTDSNSTSGSASGSKP